MTRTSGQAPVSLRERSASTGRSTSRMIPIGVGLAAVFVIAGIWGLGMNPSGGSGTYATAGPAAATGSPTGPTTFPTYLGNNLRTSGVGTLPHINLSAVAAPNASWTFASGGTIYSEPIVSNNTVYFGALDGYEYALSESSGALLWKTYLGTDAVDTNCSTRPIGVTSSAALHGTRLIVSGGNSHTYALNTTTGQIIWNVTTGGPSAAGYYVWASPMLFNGSAYIGIASRCDKPLVPAGIERLSIKTGAELAYFNTSAPNPNGSSIWASPSLSSNGTTIFVATGNPYRNLTSTYGEAIIGLNPTTLAVTSEWQIPAAQVVGDGDFGATPTIYKLSNGTPMLAAENKNGYLYAWTQSNLSPVWRTPISIGSDDDHFSASLGGGKLYVIGEQVVYNGVTYNSSLSSVSGKTGGFYWRDYFNQSVKVTYDVPLYDDGLLVVPVGPEVYFVQATTGHILATVSPGASVVPPIALANEQLFVASGSDVIDYPMPGLAGGSVPVALGGHAAPAMPSTVAGIGILAGAGAPVALAVIVRRNGSA
jgi:outer membrane protein assembly factor BamB